MSNEKTISGDIPQVIRAKMSDIRPNPHNFRKVFDDEALKTLAADIKINGMQQMPTVRSTGDMKQPFILVQGERRFRAAKLLEWTEISVQLAPANKTIAELDIAGLVENISRADLSTFEQAAACAYFVEEHKMSVSEIARKTGRSVTYVNRLVKPYAELHPSIRASWQDGHPLCTVETLGKLVSKFEGDAQKEAWDNLVQHGTFAAPEETGEDGEGGDDGEEKTNGNKEASSGFRLNSRQVMERYHAIRKSIGGKSATNEEQRMFALVQYLIGKRKALPEGIEIEGEEEKSAPAKPIRTRAARSTASA